MAIGVVRLCALSAYQARAGELSQAQYLDARVMAQLTASTVLSLQARSPGGELSPELDGLASDRLEGCGWESSRS
jgi:hypothetical protein